MAEQPTYFMLPTQLCRAKFASAQANGTSIQLTYMAVGDADYTPTDGQTALLSEKYRGQILNLETDPDNPYQVIADMYIPADVGGFVVHEVGVFDVNGDLLYIGKYPPTTKPLFENGAAKELQISLIVEMTAQANVELIVNPSVIGASKDYVDKKKAEIEKTIPLLWNPTLYCAPPDVTPRGVSLVFGSNAKLYQSTAPSGPGTAAGPQDPVNSSGYWRDLDAYNVARNMFAGIIIEWECETIPTLDDGLPLGLELDGSVADLAVYPRLERVWCGAGKNAANPAWYKCDSDGTRNAGGSYIKLQDRRDYFPFGWPHGTGTEASAALSARVAGNHIPRFVGKDGVNHLSIQVAGGRQELISAPGFVSVFGGTVDWSITAASGQLLYAAAETINRHEIFPRHVHTMYLVLV